MKKKQNLSTGILLITAIVIVVNIFSFSYFFRLDFTKDRRYTLSKATLNILDSLKHPVTVVAYYSENSIPAVTNARSDLKDMLTEYAARSGNKVVYSFINPNKSDSLEKKAQQSGVGPFPLQVRDKDEIKNVKVYLGAVIKMGDKTDVLPIIDPNSSLEYALSNSIKKLSIDKKPTVGMLEGNGEPSLEEISQLNASVSVLHNFEEVKLADSAPIPSNINTLVMLNPKDTFHAMQLNQLDAFLNRGGRMLIAYSGLNVDFRTGDGRAVDNGLRKWLAEKDIIVGSKFVIDEHCGNITVPQQMGGMTFNAQIAFPFLPEISNFSSHPVSKELRSVMFTFCSDLKFTGDTNKVKFTPLAWTSNKSGLKDVPVMFDIHHQWTDNEFPLSNLILAGAVTGAGGAKDSKMVLLTNGDFVVNGSGQQQRQQAADNINFVSNSIDWLSDNTGLIELRSKVIKSIPINDISDAKKNFLKYMNFFLPLLFVLIYGAIRFQVKKNLRRKRMMETYD